MIIGWAAAALLLPGPAHQPAIPGDLARAVREYDEAQVHSDRAALNRLLADDYLLINSSLKLRAQLIDGAAVSRQLISSLYRPDSHQEVFWSS